MDPIKTLREILRLATDVLITRIEIHGLVAIYHVAYFLRYMVAVNLFTFAANLLLNLDARSRPILSTFAIIGGVFGGIFGHHLSTRVREGTWLRGSAVFTWTTLAGMAFFITVASFLI